MPRTVSKFLPKEPSFFLEAHQVHIYGALGHRIILPVDSLDDLVAGKYPAGPAGQD